ncbi:Putative transposable element [Caligus rogercresseyi]|uniref:Transposable element n=1 Tax=Caligus rogercresseyi TaxID=217165 RepID=A0A7T8JY75_CALRO|nr:Putative transposable element [Caligus rogercresseyi]
MSRQLGISRPTGYKVKDTGIEKKVGPGAKKSLDGEKVKQILMVDPLKSIVGPREHYIEILWTKFIPWVRENFSDGNVVLQQDGAPAHTAWATQAFLRQEIDFRAKDLWPPQSPDANPWTTPSGRTLSQGLQATPPDIAALKAAVNQEWAGRTRISWRGLPGFRKAPHGHRGDNGGYIE